jgi:hypothetical protein
MYGSSSSLGSVAGGPAGTCTTWYPFTVTVTGGSGLSRRV